MCLTCSAKKKKLVELADQLIVRGILGGLPLTFYWARNRKYKAGSLALWTILIQVSNEKLLEELKDSRNSDKSFAHLNRAHNWLFWPLRVVKFSSIKAFWDKNPDTFLGFLIGLATFRSFIERLPSLRAKPFCNGPPKGFLPLPDAEIGGCARNDSLIAPAI